MPVNDSGLILVVEDRDDDILLILKAFAAAKICNPVQLVRDGEEAIAYLSGTGDFSDRDECPLPDLIMLDLKLPKVDGFEVLHWIRGQPGVQGLRVVVLTSSQDMRDVNKAYALGANSFLMKPGDFRQFVDLGVFVKEYWLKTDRKPDCERPDLDSELHAGAMKVFLLDRESEKYYAGDKEWSEEQDKAMDLKTIEDAEGMAAQKKLMRADMLLRYERPIREVRLAIQRVEK